MSSQEQQNVWLDRPANTGVVELVVRVRLDISWLSDPELAALQQVLVDIVQSFIADPQSIALEPHEEDSDICFVVVTYPSITFKKKQLEEWMKDGLDNAVGACIDGFLARPLPPKQVIQRIVEVTVPGNWKIVGIIGSLYIAFSLLILVLIMGGSLHFMDNWPALALQVSCLALAILLGFLYTTVENAWLNFRNR